MYTYKMEEYPPPSTPRI
jgi:hypothetical protein